MLCRDIILDRIKGCLTAVALSDALNILKTNTGSTYSGNATLSSSDVVKGTIDCMYALMLWRNEVDRTGAYIDPQTYIDIAIDRSAWNYDYFTPMGLRMSWCTALAAGLLGSWLFDFEEDVNSTIMAVATNPLFNLHLCEDEADNKERIMEERSRYGIFASTISNLIISNDKVDMARFLMIVYHCATRCRLSNDSIAVSASSDANKLGEKSWASLSNVLEWQGIGGLLNGSSWTSLLSIGIVYSAVLGSVNGYETFPFKNRADHLELMPAIDRLVAEIGKTLIC